MDDQYYIKMGRRYKPVRRFYGFPADGVWVVRDAQASSALIMKIGGLEYDSENLRKKVLDKERLQKIIEGVMLEGKAQSIADSASAIAEKILEDNNK